jgi:RNase H-fold protein (predicted Holliday junction resolvase)
MSNGPFLGIDIGLHRTGVALSESGLIAQPLETLAWKPPHAEAMLEGIAKLCVKYGIRTVVAGLPLGTDESPTEQAAITTAIIARLTTRLSAHSPAPEIIVWNEFHTTQDARALYPGVDKDAAAAALILQQYLDEKGGAW